jgi:hypothetical protein
MPAVLIMEKSVRRLEDIAETDLRNGVVRKAMVAV